MGNPVACSWTGPELHKESDATSHIKLLIHTFYLISNMITATKGKLSVHRELERMLDDKISSPC